MDWWISCFGMRSPQFWFAVFWVWCVDTTLMMLGCIFGGLGRCVFCWFVDLVRFFIWVVYADGFDVGYWPLGLFWVFWLLSLFDFCSCVTIEFCCALVCLVLGFGIAFDAIGCWCDWMWYFVILTLLVVFCCACLSLGFLFVIRLLIWFGYLYGGLWRFIVWLVTLVLLIDFCFAFGCEVSCYLWLLCALGVFLAIKSFGLLV